MSILRDAPVRTQLEFSTTEIEALILADLGLSRETTTVSFEVGHVGHEFMGDRSMVQGVTKIVVTTRRPTRG